MPAASIRINQNAQSHPSGAREQPYCRNTAGHSRRIVVVSGISSAFELEDV